MATAPPKFNFASGSKEIEKEAEKNRPAFDTNRPKILRYDKDEPRHILRFLDDDKRPGGDDRTNLWKGISQHSFVKTVPKPKEFQGDRWPEGMTATCRYDSGFGGWFTNCIPCDEKLPKGRGTDLAGAQTRMFARVVLRERVVWAEDDPDLPSPAKVGKFKGIADQMIQRKEIGEDGKPTGRQIWVPDIRVVEQSRKLYFQHLIGIAQSNYEDNDEEDDAYTVLDRDFTTIRSGEGAGDTSYAINEVKNSHLLVGEAGQTVEIDGEIVDLEGVTWDVRDPRVLAYYEQFIPWSLDEYFVENATDEHHERWFMPGGYAKWKNAKAEDDEDVVEEPKKGRSTRKAAARDEDDEDEAPARPAAKKRRPEPAEDDDEPEDEKPAARRPAPQVEDDEEEPARPAKKRPAPPVDDDDDDEDEPPARGGALAKYRKGMSATEDKPARARRDSSMEDDDEDAEDLQKV